jgi:hypothetical protein
MTGLRVKRNPSQRKPSIRESPPLGGFLVGFTVEESVCVLYINAFITTRPVTESRDEKLDIRVVVGFKLKGFSIFIVNIGTHGRCGAELNYRMDRHRH